jgi:hypothetical protein
MSTYGRSLNAMRVLPFPRVRCTHTKIRMDFLFIIVQNGRQPECIPHVAFLTLHSSRCIPHVLKVV